MNVLVGGGFTTIKSLYDNTFSGATTSEHAQIPLVIMKNSGRAADVFCEVLESNLCQGRLKDR